MAKYKIELEVETAHDETDIVVMGVSLKTGYVNIETRGVSALKQSITPIQDAKEEASGIIDIQGNEADSKETYDIIFNLPTNPAMETLIRYHGHGAILLENDNNIFAKAYDSIYEDGVYAKRIEDRIGIVNTVFHICEYVVNEWRDHKNGLPGPKKQSDLIDWNKSNTFHQYCENLFLKRSDDIALYPNFMSKFIDKFEISVLDSIVLKIIDIIKENKVTFIRHEEEYHKYNYYIE